MASRALYGPPGPCIWTIYGPPGPCIWTSWTLVPVHIASWTLVPVHIASWTHIYTSRTLYLDLQDPFYTSRTLYLDLQDLLDDDRYFHTVLAVLAVLERVLASNWPYMAGSREAWVLPGTLDTRDLPGYCTCTTLYSGTRSHSDMGTHDTAMTTMSRLRERGEGAR